MVKEDISQIFIELWQEAGKSSLMRVSGNSMHPFIKDGSIITVSHISPEEVRIGDIGVFKLPDRLCVHRIIGLTNEKGDSFFLEKGDNFFNVNQVSIEKFIGKVVSIKSDEEIINLETPLRKFIFLAVGIYWSLIFSFYKNIIAIKDLLNIKSNFFTRNLSRTFAFFSKTIPMLLSRLVSLGSSEKKSK